MRALVTNLVVCNLAFVLEVSSLVSSSHQGFAVQACIRETHALTVSLSIRTKKLVTEST